MSPLQIKWLTLTSVLILITAVSSFTQALRNEDYAVYDAVIGSMFKGGVTQFDMSAKVGKLVFRDHTNSEYAYGPKREQWDQVKIRLRHLTDDVIADYESKHKQEKNLKSRLNIPFEYTLISDKQLKKIFADRRNHDMTNQAWKKFYELYPRSAGYNSVSRIGYDKEKRRALVYFVNWCGDLCGTGSYVFLEKVDGKWTVQEIAGIWIS
jgi:hypothetical protein